MRIVAMVFAASLLGGCAATVENPMTGEKLSCSQGALDISPWSQSDACVADHVAQGWVIAEDQR